MTSASTHLHGPAAAFMLPPVDPATTFADASPVHLVELDDERPEDAGARESLLDRAFGLGRRAKTCERLRGGRLPATGLSLVARARGIGGVDAGVVGTVRLWHVDAGGVPALMLGPLAVDAAWRCHRVGGRLMEAAVERAGLLGHRAIVLVGDAPYYARFGFERHLARRLRMPGPVEAERLLGLELVSGALADAGGLIRATGAIDLAAWQDRRREAACEAAA